MKEHTEHNSRILHPGSDDDEPLSSKTTRSPIAEYILKKQKSYQSAGDRESTRAQLAELNGPYRSLARGSPISLWTVYRSPPQKPPPRRGDDIEREPCEEPANLIPVKQTNQGFHGCRSPLPSKLSPQPERSTASAAVTPPKSPCEKNSLSLSLSQAERAAVDLLTLDADGATAKTDWRLGEAELSPCAIYGEDSPQPSGRKRDRDDTLRSSVSQGEDVSRQLQFTDIFLSAVSQTCVASAVMRQYNERTRHRLAVECLAIPY